VLRLGHGLYFGKVVPRIGGLLSDAAAYRYLPRSVAYLPEPPALVASLAAAGFADVSRTLLTGGASQLLVATRSGAAG
jgi:demethylmenaquinone methyltransferase/2-methoxy-6-polyprenyl-1,4-benzoquinol methylase